ncbi:MAG: InlB B-repeat-containing protein [Lachnospiraceae bacterium]|nr:InlB B-repeat-containing protein [Lachnospiraceae bacterium]
MYYSIKDALEACEENKELFEKFTIEILENTEETIVVDQGLDVTIDLQGKTITGKEASVPTLKITEGNKLVLLDTVEGGAVVSTDGVAVRIDENATFVMGIDEKPINLTAPKVQGKTKGIEAAGTFNFYDGVIYGEQTVDGLINEMPLLYNGVTIDNGDSLKTTLGIISNVEARIGRNTYMKLEDAVADAGTLIGEDGNQVEIVLVKDVTKTEKVVIDETKNILLNLDGYRLTTDVADYVIENNGKLEVTSTPDYQKGTKLVPVSNETYYFVEADGVYKSNNTGVNNGVANSYVEIDLTNYSSAEQFDITVNAEIDSQANNDLGYATVNTSTTVPTYNTTAGRFIYISGTVEATDYTTTLTGGQKYYLHLGYRKNGNTNTGTDTFTVNSIEVTDSRGISIEEEIRGKSAGKITSTTYDTILNNGQMKVSDGIIEIAKVGTSSVLKNAIVNEGQLEIAGGVLQSGVSYTNMIQNGKTNELNGDAVVKLTGGTIGSTVNRIYGIYNYANGVVESAGGKVSTYDIAIYSFGTLKLDGGTIKSSNSRAINIGNTVTREIIIKNATIKGIFGVYNDSRPTGLEVLVDNCNISGFGTGVTYGVYNNSSSGTINVSNSTISEIKYAVYNSYTGVINVNNSTMSGTNYYLVYNSGSGVITVLNSEIINGGNGVYNASSGTIDIENCFIESTGSTVIVNGSSGTINIKSGEIVGYSNNYTINNAARGTINIGTKDGEINEEEVIIRLGTGISNISTGKVNFYDGKIVTLKANEGLMGSINDIEEGVDIVKTTGDTYNTYTLGTNIEVAQVGETKYNSVQEAVEACGTSEEQKTVTILKDIITAREIVIDEGQNIKLDINGHSILVLNEGITNNGKLELVNGLGTTHKIYARTQMPIITNNGELVIGNVEISRQTAAGSSSSYINVVYNTGKLVLNGGTISATTDYTRGISNVGEIIVNSGTITGTGSNGGMGIITSGEGKTIINGGTIAGGRRGIYAKDSSEIVITGGNINSKSDYAIYIDNSTSNNVNIRVEGGTITGGSYGIYSVNNNGEIVIKEENENVPTIIKGNSGICLQGESVAEIDEGEVIAGSYEGIVLDGTSKLVLKGGIVKSGTSANGYEAISLSGTSSLEMSGGEALSEKGYGIEINSTTVTAKITGGRVASGKSGTTTYSGIKNNGILVLGEKIAEGNVENPSIVSPEIIGTKYGVENIGTFKFYDGIIEGQLNGSIYGSVAEWEEGYEVIKTNNEELARETAIVSRMSAVKIVETGVEYGSISEAITASSTNKCTIQLLRSNILIDTVIVSEGQEIVLDLAGYSLTSQNEIMLQNDGTLKITNSTNASSTIENQLGEVVQNNGNLILENVTISHITETNRGTVLNAGVMKINSGTIKNTVGGNNVSVVYNTGKLELNEGTISYNYNTTGTTTSRGVYNTGELIVNGGSITVNKDYGIYTVGTSKVTINGGTLLGPTGIYAESSSEIRVTGGSITGGTAGTAYGIHIANNSNVNLVIEGGKIEGQDGIYVPNNTGEIIIKEVNENIQTLIEGSTGIYLSGESTIKIEGGTVFGEYNGIDAAKSSKIELTGGNIKNTKVNGTHYSAISLKDSSQLEMSGGEVIGETGLAINVGTINAKAIITGGKVSSGQNGTIKNTAINNIGTLVLGEKIAEDASETPSIINPEIIGTKYGVSNAGTFKFYDGIITGTNGYEAIYGGVSELEEEYDIIKTKNTEEQIETAVLSNASAVKIVETEETYSSILEAVEACNTNEYTIQLLRNIVTPLDLVTIGEGQNITLDLAGYTITARNNAIFKNEGTFVIIDSSDSKSGKIENFVGSVLDNSGISRIESGTIKTISTNNIAKIAISNSGKLIVNGGTISGEKNAEGIDSESDNIGIYNTGELIVNGGKIFGKTTKSYSSCHGRGIHNAGGKLTVNGGEISAEGMGNSETAAIYVEGEGNEIKFTNGIVKDTNSAISIISGAKGTVEISGGELAGNYGVYANNVPDFDIVITGGKVTATDNGIYLIGASKARIEGGKLESTSSSNYAIQITGTSVLEINGGEVVSRYHGIHISSNATLMMTGGEVCSEQIGIRMDSKTATATITGGTVSSVATGSSKYSAIYNEGTLTLGDNATRVSTINPEITGTSYGVENTGTFKFYDGIIRGPSGAIYGAVSEVADDHKVQNLDDGKTATLEVDAEFAQVAELNGVYYNTLDVAIASASGGAEQTIKICTDVNLNEGITIPAGKNIKIDLNGYVIRGIFEGALITNNGTLTVVDIIDTSALLEGEVINAIVQNTAGIGIQNNGTLNIGVLTRTVEETKLTIAGSTAGIVNSGSLTLNGGQVKGATAISGNAATPRSGYTITTTTLENLETTKLTSSIGVQTDPSDVVGADDSALPEQGDESTSTDPVTQYLISYDANGGTNTPQAQYKIAGQGIVLVGQPTRDGFAFAGWSTEQAGTIAEYMPGNTYEEDAILILYAIWE